MSMKNIVILGAGYAGSLAAIRIARRGIPVTVIDSSPGLVDRIRLHQLAAGDAIVPIPYEKLFRGLPIQFVRARALSIDRKGRVVKTMAGDIGYDQLVYALGSFIDVPEHALALNGPAAAKQIRQRIGSTKRVIVAGGGLTGIELASEVAERFPDVAVTLVEASTIDRGLSAPAARYLYEWFAAHGVIVREHCRIATVEQDGAVLESGESIPGLVLWCGSFQASPLGREAGLEVNQRDQILVDDALRSSDPSIYVAGDAAAYRDVRMACATAMPMAAHVADEISGLAPGPFRFAFVTLCISLGRRDGLVQLKNADDTPKTSFLTGRAAAWVKELIARLVPLAIRMERVGVRYRWLKAA